MNHLLCTQNSPNTPISPYLFKYLRHSKYGHESFLVFHHLRLNISMTLAIVLQWYCKKHWFIFIWRLFGANIGINSNVFLMTFCNFCRDFYFFSWFLHFFPLLLFTYFCTFDFEIVSFGARQFIQKCSVTQKCSVSRKFSLYSEMFNFYSELFNFYLQ